MILPSLFDEDAVYQASDILNLPEARRRRDQAISQVDRNAEPGWKQRAQEAISRVALRKDEFTTDDVWALLDERGIEAPHEPRAMGAITRWASSKGIIRATDRYAMSARPECHGRPIRVWQSLVF